MQYININLYFRLYTYVRTSDREATVCFKAAILLLAITCSSLHLACHNHVFQGRHLFCGHRLFQVAILLVATAYYTCL
jgi:hypothetical protein